MARTSDWPISDNAAAGRFSVRVESQLLAQIRDDPDVVLGLLQVLFSFFLERH